MGSVSRRSRREVTSRTPSGTPASSSVTSSLSAPAESRMWRTTSSMKNRLPSVSPASACTNDSDAGALDRSATSSPTSVSSSPPSSSRRIVPSRRRSPISSCSGSRSESSLSR